MKRYTYRCDDIKAIRIRAIKERTATSFQKLVDLYIDELLYKLQYETEMFRDLPDSKQAQYVVKDVLEIPTFKRFFKFRPQRGLDNSRTI